LGDEIMSGHKNECSRCGSTKTKKFWDYEDDTTLCDRCHETHWKEWQNRVDCPKHKRILTIAVIVCAVLLVALAIFTTITYNKLEESNYLVNNYRGQVNSLTAENNRLIQENEDCVNDYNELSSECQDLSDQCNELISDYNDCVDELGNSNKNSGATAEDVTSTITALAKLLVLFGI
jgi:uncharacterized protein YoxC